MKTPALEEQSATAVEEQREEAGPREQRDPTRRPVAGDHTPPHRQEIWLSGLSPPSGPERSD